MSCTPTTPQSTVLPALAEEGGSEAQKTTAMERIGDLLAFLGQCARRTMVLWDIIKHAVGKWAKMSAKAVIQLVKEYFQCTKSYQEHSEIIDDVVGDGSIGNVPSIAARNVPHVSEEIPIVRFDGDKEEEKSQKGTSTMSKKASNAEEHKQAEEEKEGGVKDSEEEKRKADEDKAALEEFFADKKRRRQKRKSRTGVQSGTRTTCRTHGA